jgi:hypothetical protein
MKATEKSSSPQMGAGRRPHRRRGPPAGLVCSRRETPVYLAGIGVTFISPEAVLVIAALLAVYAAARGMRSPEAG